MSAILHLGSLIRSNKVGFHVTVKVAHMYNVSPDFDSQVSISVKSAGTGGHLQTRFASHQTTSPDASPVIVFNQVFEFVAKLSPSGKVSNTFDKKIMSFASHVKHPGGKIETFASNGKLNLADIVNESREMCIKKDVLCVLGEDLICPVELIVYTVPMALKSANERLTMESYLRRVDAAKKKKAQQQLQQQQQQQQQGLQKDVSDASVDADGNRSTQHLQRSRERSSSSPSVPIATLHQKRGYSASGSVGTIKNIGKSRSAVPDMTKRFGSLPVDSIIVPSSNTTAPLRATALISAATLAVNTCDDSSSSSVCSSTPSPPPLMRASTFAELAKLRSSQSHSEQSSPVVSSPTPHDHAFASVLADAAMDGMNNGSYSGPALSAAAVSRRRSPSTMTSPDTIASVAAQLTLSPLSSPQVAPGVPPPKTSTAAIHNHDDDMVDFFDDMGKANAPNPQYQHGDSAMSPLAQLPPLPPSNTSPLSTAYQHHPHHHQPGVEELMQENALLKNQIQSMRLQYAAHVQKLRSEIEQLREELRTSHHAGPMPDDPFSYPDSHDTSFFATSMSFDNHSNSRSSNNPFY